MEKVHAGHTQICSGLLGELKFSRLLIADNHWSRLRGWYGYQPRQYNPAGLDAVLLTRTASIQTMAMSFGLDLFWLDKAMCCIGSQLNVRPWRCCWYAQAAHVIERPTNPDDSELLAFIRQQPLKIFPGSEPE